MSVHHLCFELYLLCGIYLYIDEGHLLDGCYIKSGWGVYVATMLSVVSLIFSQSNTTQITLSLEFNSQNNMQ